MKIDLGKLVRRPKQYARPRCVPFRPEVDELLTRLKDECGIEPNKVIREAVDLYVPELIKRLKHSKSPAA